VPAKRESKKESKKTTEKISEEKTTKISVSDLNKIFRSLQSLIMFALGKNQELMTLNKDYHVYGGKLHEQSLDLAKINLALNVEVSETVGKTSPELEEAYKKLIAAIDENIKLSANLLIEKDLRKSSKDTSSTKTDPEIKKLITELQNKTKQMNKYKEELKHANDEISDKTKLKDPQLQKILKSLRNY